MGESTREKSAGAFLQVRKNQNEEDTRSSALTGRKGHYLLIVQAKGKRNSQFVQSMCVQGLAAKHSRSSFSMLWGIAAQARCANQAILRLR